MKIFQKERNNVQSIAFMSIMAAVIVVLNLLATFFPFLFFLLIFIIPFVSCLVTLTCKKYFFPIFFLVALGISMVSTLWDFTSSLFYIAPSLLAGFAFGICLEKKFPNIFMIIIPALIYMGFTYISIPIIKAIYNIDVITSIIETLKLSDKKEIYSIVPAAIFSISLIQSTISFIIFKNEENKLGLEVKETKYDLLICFISSILFLILEILFGFINFAISLLMMALFISTSTYIVIKSLCTKNKLIYVLNALAFLVGIIIFISLYQYIPDKRGILLLSSFFAISLIISFIYFSLKKSLKNIQ